MRFYDFIEDIRQTSERIAQRDAYLDLDVTTDLTIKTLMRPDVTAFFDQLVALERNVLPPTKILIFYLIMFVYTVNLRPRPIYDDLVAFSGKLLKRLAKIDLMTEKNRVLCMTDKTLLHPGLTKHLHSLINLKPKAGLYAQYASKSPAQQLVAKLCDTSFSDASLLLYAGPPVHLPDLQGNDRFVYVGRLFTSNRFELSGYYIRATF